MSDDLTRCPHCGRWKTLAGRSSDHCETKKCPGNWYAGRESDAEFNEKPGALVLRGEEDPWTGGGALATYLALCDR